jgi:peroxiredoxin
MTEEHVMTSAPTPGQTTPTVGERAIGKLELGGKLPDFELLDHAGNRRRLSALVGGDPTVVQFFRGWWCPKEQAFFKRLLVLQDDAEVAYSRIVSISVDPPEVNAALRAGLGARWTFLSDPDRDVQSQLGLRETTDTLHHPYVPAVFVIDPELRIHVAYNGYWYWGRPTHSELVHDLRELTRALRPDWDAPTP